MTGTPPADPTRSRNADVSETVATSPLPPTAEVSVDVVLISTYELGHQPFGLASPAAWLRDAGANVTCVDLSVEALDEDYIRQADLIAFYVPMHTATRLAVWLVKHVRAANRSAHICFYGLYAPMNEKYLRKLGADTIIGGEFEEALCSLARRIARERAGERAPATQHEPVISLARLKFRTPDRSALPALRRYAYLDLGDGRRRVAGYTEASRGCKHACRHCPVVPVYNGRFRIVRREIVLEDIAHQVAAGAEHITFGDPDFFNGPGHALAVVHGLHEQFPQLTYDVTIKIEHLLKHAAYLPTLRDTGCLFVTSAVESADDRILVRFDKQHSRADFIDVVRFFDEIGMTINPTFVTFTPWTSLKGYLDLLNLLASTGVTSNVTPIQYAIRLLIPKGSKLLELPDVTELVGAFDEEALVFPWKHPDPRVDRLYKEILHEVEHSSQVITKRREVFARVWEIAANAYFEASGVDVGEPPPTVDPRIVVPSLSEPWYCCAEPTGDQIHDAAQLLVNTAHR